MGKPVAWVLVNVALAVLLAGVAVFLVLMAVLAYMGVPPDSN